MNYIKKLLILLSSVTTLMGEPAAVGPNGEGMTNPEFRDAVLPAQTDQSGKYLKTNGTAATWEDVTGVTAASVSSAIAAFDGTQAAAGRTGLGLGTAATTAATAYATAAQGELADSALQRAEVITRTLTAGEAGPTNSSTLQSSGTLTMPLSVGTWDIEALIVVNAMTQSAGVSQALDFSGTGTWTGCCYHSINSAVTSTTWPNSRLAANLPSSVITNASSSSATLRIGTVTVTVAGTLSVQIASSTATPGVNAELALPSYLRALRISP